MVPHLDSCLLIDRLIDLFNLLIDRLIKRVKAKTVEL